MKKMITTHTWVIFFFFYLVSLSIYALYSYSLTAPNLILSSWPPYWKFQTYMWSHFFNDRQILSQYFLVIITSIWFFYYTFVCSIIWYVKKCKKNTKNLMIRSRKIIVLGIIVVFVPLLLSVNALSYDVFNYLFNAKMVVIYHANPHLSVALDYAYDDWTRFMHNVHTPAPYGYGWTILSLIPYLIGFGKLLPTIISFKLFSILSIILLAWCYQITIKSFSQSKSQVNKMMAIFIILNPLLLIEIVTNVHNDLWMMVPSIAAILLIRSLSQQRSVYFGRLLLAGILFILSVSIKFATVLLLPIILLLIMEQLLQKKWSILSFWSFFASLVMFVPLLTARSQQFHPWYLTWVLVWLPFFHFELRSYKHSLFKKGYETLEVIQIIWFLSIITLSTSSLFRYYPYLLHGEFTDTILLQQKLITWIPFVISLVFFSIIFSIPAMNKKVKNCFNTLQ